MAAHREVVGVPLAVLYLVGLYLVPEKPRETQMGLHFVSTWTMWRQNGGPFAFLWNYRPLLISSPIFGFLAVYVFQTVSPVLLSRLKVCVDLEIEYFSYELSDHIRKSSWCVENQS